VREGLAHVVTGPQDDYSKHSLHKGKKQGVCAQGGGWGEDGAGGRVRVSAASGVICSAPLHRPHCLYRPIG